MSMPTSFPRLFPEVRFPAEFTALYNKPPAYIDEGSSFAVGSGVGTPFDGIDANTLYHKTKHEDMLRMAKGKALSEQKRRINQVTGQANRSLANTEMLNTLQGSGAPVASPPFGAGVVDTPVLAGRGLSGGVMRTQAGQQFLRAALKKREEDFNRIDLARQQLLEEFPQSQAPAFSADDDVVAILGGFIDGLNDAIATGALGDANSEAQEVLNTLKRIGWKLPQQQVTLMLRQISEQIRELNDALANRPGTTVGYTAAEKKVARSLGSRLVRIAELLRSITSDSTLSARDRKLRLSAAQMPLQRTAQAQLIAAQQAAIPGRRGRLAPGQGQMYMYQNVPGGAQGVARRADVGLPAQYFIPGGMPQYGLPRGAVPRNAPGAPRVVQRDAAGNLVVPAGLA